MIDPVLSQVRRQRLFVVALTLPRFTIGASLYTVRLPAVVLDTRVNLTAPPAPGPPTQSAPDVVADAADALDRDAQALIIDWPYKPASQPNCRLLERHDLEAVTPVPCRRESGLPHREAAVDNAR